MPKSKHSPALFELLRKDRSDAADGLKVPAWIGEPATSRAAGAVGATGLMGPQAREKPVSDDGQHGVSLPPLVDLDGPVLRISLSPKSGAVAVFALMVLLVAAYGLGRTSSGGINQSILTDGGVLAPTDEITELQHQPPNPQLVEGLTVASQPSGARSTAEVPRSTPPDTRRNSAGPKVSWAKDHTYIMVQEFSPGNADDARRAQEFLKQHGIPTAIVVLGNGIIHLTTTEGYNRKDPSQATKADELLRRVHAVGDKFFAAGGRYRLKGYFKTLKEDTW